MSRSSAAQVLDRPGTDGEAAESVHVPALVLPLPTAARPAAAPPRPGRRLPHPPGRRAPLWFAALVTGAVLAAVPSVLGDGPSEVPVSSSDYGLGAAADGNLTGGMGDAGVRTGITAAEANARLGELAASRAAREPRTVLPTTGRLTTCFCMRWGQMHYGIDLAAPLGTQIVSATDGVVLRAGPATGFGNAVYIQDADGNVHVYGHMRYYSVRAGQIVHAGDPIAKVGNQGQSTGPHLHYEIRRGGPEGRAFDPIPWLADRGVHL